MFEDVTSQFENKTRGGAEVIRVEMPSRPYAGGHRISVTTATSTGALLWGTRWKDGRVVGGRDDSDDLIPIPPPSSPWDDVLPFIGEWWKGNDCSASLGGIRIVEFENSENTVLLGDGHRVPLRVLREKYLHSQTPHDESSWKRVGE